MHRRAYHQEGDEFVYQIGEFSKITSITVKALRYYDEEGLLEPSIRLSNNYRVYNQDDYEKAKVILLLRSLDFSIQEIKDVLTNYQREEDLIDYLKEKKELIRQNMKKERNLMNQLDQLITPIKKMEAIAMDYQFERKDIPSIKVISVRYIGRYQDMSKYIPLLYKVAKGCVDGAPFNVYYDEDYKEEANIEICLPVKKSVLNSKVTYKELPQIKALCTTHTGSYDTLNYAYKAILDEARKKEIKLLLPSREVYEKGPGMILKGNPSKYQTQIIIPIQKEEK